MPTVIFVTPAGAEHVVTASAGQSLMEAAVKHGVPGVVAECGGACNCATCHVYVNEAFLPLVGPAGDWEREMLEDAVAPVLDTSRLSCQVRLTEDLEGLRVDVAPEQ